MAKSEPKDEKKGHYNDDGELLCPRCQRVVTGWPVRRPDSCSPKHWAYCIRNREDVQRDWRTKSRKLNEGSAEEIMHVRCHSCDDWVFVTANEKTLPKKACPKCERVGQLMAEQTVKESVNAKTLLSTLNEEYPGAEKKFARHICKCKFCNKVWRYEGEMNAQTAEQEILRHAIDCPQTEEAVKKRIKGYSGAYGEKLELLYSDPKRRAQAAYNMWNVTVKTEQVHGVYNPDIKCGGRCRSSKGPSCECSCGGANHGSNV